MANCKYLVLKCAFVLLLVLVSTSRTLAAFRRQFLIVNETEGTVEVTLLRNSSSGAATSVVRLMTLQEFSERVPQDGDCQTGLENLRSINASEENQAQAGSDFTPSRADVEFADGELAQTFTISITDDNVAEPIEEIFMVVVEEEAPLCAFPVVIKDDDVVRLNFNVREDSLTVSENVTYRNLSIVKEGQHEMDFTVTISLRSTSATEGEDFVLTRKDFVFSSTTTERVVRIEIFDQGLAEGIESFVICLPSTLDDTRIRVEVSDPQCFKLTLFDDDEPVLGFVGHGSEPFSTISEGETETICVGKIGGNLNVQNFVELRTTLFPSLNERVSFTEFPPFLSMVGEVLQLAFTSDSAATCTNATAVQNDVVDGDVTVVLNLDPTGPSADLGVRLGSTNFTLEIRDDDFNTITLTRTASKGGPPPTIREGQDITSILPITVNRGGPSTSLTYVVTLTTQARGGGDGTGSGSDLIFDPVVIDPSVSSALVTFTLADDSVAELTGELEIVIASVEIGNGRQGAIPQHSGSVPLDLIDDDILVGFSETQLMLSEGGVGSLDILIPASARSGLQGDTQVTVTITLQHQGGETDFVSVEPSGSPIVLSTEVPATSLRLVASDDNLCTGVKIYTISFSDSMSSSFYTAVAVEGRSNISISITDDDCTDMTTTSDMSATNIVVGTGKSSKSSVCVACIVIPIFLILLCCLLCLLLIILWLCCCKKRCWHTYDPQTREKKFGEKPAPVELDDSLLVKYGKIDIDSPSPV